LVGVLGEDAVTLTETGSFASKNVGTGIAVTAADGLGGADAGNYTFAEPTGLAANITPATLTVSGTTVASRVYNGATAAALAGGSLAGLFGNDAVALTQAGTFGTKNVGSGIAVTASDSIGGASAGDYILVDPTGLAGNITPATLTVSGTAVANKVYNASATASLNGGSLLGLIGDDSVTLTQAGTFASKNVGIGIAVTASDSLGGTSAGNYVLVDPTGLTANITPASLTVSGTAVGSKVYNGSSVASLSGGSLVGVLGGDAVTLTQAGAFGSKNTGSDIAVTATDGLSGASAGDYLLVEPTRLAGDITPASLTVIDTSVGPKVYNGTTAATLSGGRLVGVVSGDTVSLTQAGTFASAHVGSGIAVTADDGLGGANASDYTITEPTGLTGSIVAAVGPVVPPATGSTPPAVLAAQAEIESTVLAPAVGAEPQTLNASTTIEPQATSSALAGGDAATDAGAASGMQQPAVVVNVSMNIGANGTLTIQAGGLRLPENLSVGTQ